MKLSDIHAIIEAGPGAKIPAEQAFATLVAIEHLARIEGTPVSALDFSTPVFGKMHTYHRKDLGALDMGRAQYLSWRNLILNAQMFFAPGDTDADPWRSLSRAERLFAGKSGATLYNLRKFLPADVRPCDVSHGTLLKTLHHLAEKEHTQFRAGVNSFRRLFKNDLALRSGLLPSTCPERLKTAHEQKAGPMSPEITRFKTQLSKRFSRTAVTFVNRLAIAAGLLNGETDTLDDLRKALGDLPLPTEAGLEYINPKLASAYVAAVRKALGGRDFRLSEIGQAWADLRAVARAQGCDTSFLWALAKPATRRGLGPRDISENVALEIIKSYPKGAMWSHCRKGCEQFDALRGKVPSEFLPPDPVGVRRQPSRPPRKPKPTALLSPAEMAWSELYARLREQGWSPKRCGELSYLRPRATSAGYAPRELTQSFIKALERDTTKSDRTRLRTAVVSISALSKDPDFADLPDLSTPEDRRFSHGGLGEQARAELEELMDFMNAAPSTRRALRVSVGALTDATGRSEMPLRELLQTDMSAYDLGSHEPRRKAHTEAVRNLRDFVQLEWTPAWQELQRLAIGVGMSPQSNPVPKILSWKPGTDPSGLTLEWAQNVDKSLRSTLKNPPHGRADLALTLARQLGAFDALHDIPNIAGSKLLPPKLGPIR